MSPLSSATPRPLRRSSAPTASARALAAVAASLGLLLSAACAGDDASSTTVDLSSTTAAPTSASTASTEPTTTAATAPARPTGYAATAPDAAGELKDAWEAGDVARASAIAPPEVVGALWAVPNTGWETYGCQRERPEVVTNRCNWRNRGTGGYIQVNTERFEQGWQVTTIRIGQD